VRTHTRAKAETLSTPFCGRGTQGYCAGCFSGSWSVHRFAFIHPHLCVPFCSRRPAALAPIILSCWCTNMPRRRTATFWTPVPEQTCGPLDHRWIPLHCVRLWRTGYPSVTPEHGKTLRLPTLTASDPGACALLRANALRHYQHTPPLRRSPTTRAAPATCTTPRTHTHTHTHYHCHHTYTPPATLSHYRRLQWLVNTGLVCLVQLGRSCDRCSP